MPFKPPRGAAQRELAATVQPQLATLVSRPPAGDDWLHELKLDGYRLICRIDAGEARLFTRNANDWTESFPAIARACLALPCERALLDGEAVVMNAEGRTDFQALQRSFGEQSPNLFLFAFDLLHLDGWDLRECTLLDRKEALRSIVGGSIIRFSDHVIGRGDEFFAEACRLRAEGIVSKRTDSRYRSARTRDWLKIKCLRRQEFVIVGFTDPSRSRKGIGALLVAAHDADDDLVFCGKVGTGYTHELLLELRRRLEPLERRDPPVVNPLRGADARGVHWVEPRLVAEVAFTEWTGDGVIRHPSFRGLRRDKTPEEIRIERPAD